MDPTFVTRAEWFEITQRLVFFWLFLACMIGFGFSFLIAHAFIPSLVFTHQLPAQADRARRLFYASAGVCLVAAIVFLALALNVFRTIEGIFPRWWQ